MSEILTVIFGFLIFMLVFKTGYLAVIRPASLVILVSISLVVGAVLANTICWFFVDALTWIIPIIIIGVVILILRK